MKSALLQLYNGEILPMEQYLPKTEEYQAMRQQQLLRYEDFIQELERVNPALKEQFVEIMDEQVSAIPLEASEIFISGFRLGARIMTEVFAGDAASTQ